MTLSESVFQGVILAGGRASRLFPLNRYFLKPLLPVCNRPLIDYQLELMRKLKISEVFIVSNHLIETLKKEVALLGLSDFTIHFVEQKNPSGIAHALSFVEDFIKKPMVVFLGDIFIYAPALYKLIEMYNALKPCSLLGAKVEQDIADVRHNYNIITDGIGKVVKVVEKPQNPLTSLKGCGIYVFETDIFDAIRRTSKTDMRNEYELTSSIQILIDGGKSVYPFNLIDLDKNINTVKDFYYCNMDELNRRKKNVEIGKNIIIHPTVKINKSIIGNNICITHPAIIESSIILDNVIINSNVNLSHVVVAPEGLIEISKL